MPALEIAQTHRSVRFHNQISYRWNKKFQNMISKMFRIFQKKKTEA